VTQALKFILFGSALVAAGDFASADEDSHASSARLSAEIAAGLPKYVPKGNEPAPAARPAPPQERQAAADPSVSVLPAVTVTEARLPTPEGILTKEARAQKFVAAYMGDSDGLDRGFLNRFTLQQLWKMIPILGRLPFVGTPGHMTNEQRAFDRAGANDPLGRPVQSPNEPPD
jgi:hypothetical protein